jgi:hypothetical protein
MKRFVEGADRGLMSSSSEVESGSREENATKKKRKSFRSGETGSEGL